MDWVLIVILQVMLQPSLSVLLTVEAERTTYESKFGEEVVMGCRFQPKLSTPNADLKVTWHWISSPTSAHVRDVYRMDNMKENLASQDPDYRGRVTLLSEELREGRTKLQISRLRINDSGIYQCLVQTEDGADFKKITLSVVAPYKTVTKVIEKAAGDELVLTCQSEGYPESSVTWHDGHQWRLDANTTAESTPDQLVKVTSQIRVRSTDKNNYTCTFNGGSSATFHIPDEISVPRNDAVIIVLSIVMVMAVVMAVVLYRRQKGSRTHSTRNLLVDGRGKRVPAAASLQKDKDNEEEITFGIYEGCMEENLGEFLKGHYSDFSISAEASHNWDALSVTELSDRLQNNKGQSVNLQALLPQAGEICFLEGTPGSGKTTIATILVSSWTQGRTHALSNLLDLSTLRLLLYVDCSKVKGDLFQEITIQRSLTKKTEDQLRTVITRSSDALLLLDGYREGNQMFDESLRKFLMDRGGCRVLVMACPGHCPTLKDSVGTEGVLQLRTQTVKY